MSNLKLYGILAHPAGHSLSPVMHNAAFKALGLNASYEFFDVEPAALAGFMADLRASDIFGLSVSLPHKEAVMPFLDEVDGAAREIGAVNTIVREDTAHEGGRFVGYNTDFLGSNRALREVVGNLRGVKVLVLGAGGAARAVVYGLKKAGASVVIFNRHVEKARILAEEFGMQYLAKLEDAVKVDIVVQASSIWTLNPTMSHEEIEAFLSSSFLKACGAKLVMDVVYKPLKTPLIAMAEELEIRTITGEKMLLYQAAEQFKLWTGMEAPLELMREALLLAMP